MQLLLTFEAAKMVVVADLEKWKAPLVGGPGSATQLRHTLRFGKND